MINKGFWMHENSMDVFIEIISIKYRDNKRMKFKGRYWNLGYSGTPWLISIDLNFTILTEDFTKWKKINFQELHTKRIRSGLPTPQHNGISE